MFQCQLRAVADLYGSDAVNSGLKSVVDRPAPALGDGLYAVCHAQNGTDSGCVAVGVKSCLDCHADGIAVIAVSIQQASCDDHGVGDCVTPSVGGMFVVFFMNLFETIFFRNTLTEIFQYSHDFCKES